MRWRAHIEPFARPFMQACWRLTRGATLGVRAVAERPDGRIALVRHTYINGWHLPGGGVEAGETAIEAVGRELAEEAGVRLTDPPELLGIFANHSAFRGDHVLLYRACGWVDCESQSQGEIECVDWFSPTDLPAGTAAGTQRRIAEIYQGAARVPHW
ncbi:NUDIX domain-containing protein [Maricaulis sp.]|uniref:NUDIX domain-containing protein n=1 Tax=Maricaulis sp. TaxID=1486257 RepID=UPI003A90AEA9